VAENNDGDLTVDGLAVMIMTGMIEMEVRMRDG
jgi:hypothetical protein